MKVYNKSNKIIGFGDVSILPGETREIPKEYEGNPVLKFYQNSGFVKVSGKAAAEEENAAKEAADAEAAVAEELRKQRLASLKGISDEDLATLAIELGISPTECKDQEELLKIVRGALKK